MNLKERLERLDWKDLARTVKFNARGRCQLCGARFPPPYHGLQAHHNNYERLGNELPSDLIALCDACHVHFEWRRKYGDLASVPLYEMLGIVERERQALEEVHEHYERYTGQLRIRLGEIEEEVGMLLSATDVGRWYEENERRAA